MSILDFWNLVFCSSSDNTSFFNALAIIYSVISLRYVWKNFIDAKEGEVGQVVDKDKEIFKEKKGKKEVSLKRENWLDFIKSLKVSKLYFFYFNVPILFLLFCFVEGQV